MMELPWNLIGFLSLNPIVEEHSKIHQCVSSGDDFYQSLVFIEMSLAEGKPPSPFKLNSERLKEEEFVK